MVRAVPLMLALCLLPHGASAQPARAFELSGGYSLARDPRDNVTLPSGWIATASVGVTNWLAAVADVSGQYKTIALFESEAHLSVLTVMVGPRASGRFGRLTEFGQVLVGVVRTSGSAFGSTSSSHSLSIQPGVGVDYGLTPRLAARAELDVRLINDQPETENGGYQYRVVAALVYRMNPR